VVSAGEGAVERVTLTTDDATMPAADAIAAIFQGHGFTVEHHAFIRTLAEEPRRVVLLTLPRPLPALVPLVVPPTALPGLSAALVAALYPEPDRDVPDTWAPLPTALATVQLKAEGAFVSISARTEQELTDALRMLAGRVRRATGAALPLADRERRIAYVDGTWYSE